MRLLSTTLLGCIALPVVFAACNKSGKETAAPNTNDLQATSEIAVQGANNEILMLDDEHLVDMNIPLYLSDSRIPFASSIPSTCPKITITPATGFPRTIVMDFGEGCTRNGVTRSGQIVVMMSDYRDKPGSTVITTYNNYFVNRVKTEGKITWNNTTTDGARGWVSKIENLKMTRPDGKFTVQNAIKETRQIAGVRTTENNDDGFATTGRGMIKTSEGASRSHAITTPLEKFNNCRWISKGVMKTEGNGHSVVMDYGNGTCDNKATITKDGGEPSSIELR